MGQERVWDNIAGKWNKFRVRMSPSAEKFVLDKKGKILDVGCGSGRNFVNVNGLEWTAVDFSSNMVKFAEAKAKRLGIDATIMKADSTKLPFADGVFDYVICFALLHCIESGDARRKTLEEIFRVLRKDGEALISAWGTNSPRLKNKNKECYVPWTVKEKAEKQMRYTYVYDFEELVDLCKEVGFEIVRAWEERNVNVIVRKN